MTTPTREDCQAALSSIPRLQHGGYFMPDQFLEWVTKNFIVISHALSAMADPDWQLVPKEPTEDIWKIWLKGYPNFTKRYEAMLSAAPTYGSEK